MKHHHLTLISSLCFPVLSSAYAQVSSELTFSLLKYPFRIKSHRSLYQQALLLETEGIITASSVIDVGGTFITPQNAESCSHAPQRAHSLISPPLTITRRDVLSLHFIFLGFGVF